MGLLNGGGKFDWGEAALGLFADPRVMALRRQRLDEQAKEQAEAGELAKLQSMIDADPTLQTPQDKAYAKANPKAYLENYLTRFQSRQFGPGGGSISTPGAGGAPQFQMAPSRHEYQGSVYDVAGGPMGAKAPVTPQHEGTQWVTPNTGATAIPVNSFTGARRDGGDPSGLPRVSTPAEAAQLPPGTKFIAPDGSIKVVPGGAGPQTPPTFPY